MRERDRDGPPWRAVLHRVVEQIHEELLPTQRIDLRVDPAIDAHVPLVPSVVPHASCIDCPFGDGRDVGNMRIDLESPRVHVGRIEQLRDERRKTPGLAHDRCDRIPEAIVAPCGERPLRELGVA